MSILSISIVIFIIMESMNVLILYLKPDSRLGNSIGVFDSWHDAKKDEPLDIFVHYMAYWVAGTKLIFIVLLLVVLFTGTETTRLFAVGAMILSIAMYFVKLHPIINSLAAWVKLHLRDIRRLLAL